MTQQKIIRLSDTMSEVIELMRRGGILVHYDHSNKTSIIIRKDRDREVKRLTFRALLNRGIICLSQGDEYKLTELGYNISI